MRDLLILLVLSGVAIQVWRQPWLGVLVLAVLTYLNPQSYADGFIRTAPLFLFFYVLTLTRFVTAREWLSSVWLKAQLNWLLDWRIFVIVAFWLQTTFSTYNAELLYFSQDNWVTFTKALLGLALTPLLIDTPKKLTLLSITIGLSISVIALKGGFWSLTHGQLDRVYGPELSEFYDNNGFAIAALMSIPLLLVLFDQHTTRSRRWVISGLIIFCLIAVLSTWSRGAFLALVISGLMLLVLRQKGNLKYFFMSVLTILVLFFIMPVSWFERMQSIVNFSSDDSAVSRLTIWSEGIRLGFENPLLGLGFDGWRYIGKLDWHSAYVESFAEHGVIGFMLWVSLLFGSMLHLYLMFINPISRPWVKKLSLYFMISLLAYSVGALFLGITYWSLFYQIVLLSVILSRIQHHQPGHDLKPQE